MRLYIAGPMSGLDEHNYPEFHRVRELLSGAGYSVLAPTDSSWDWDGGETDPEYYEVLMRRGIQIMLRCDAVAMLTNWPSSKGAQLEVNLARDLGMLTQHYEWWLSEALRVKPEPHPIDDTRRWVLANGFEVL